MRPFALIIALLCGPAFAHGWVVLTNGEIQGLLSDTTVEYPNARQTFYASGRTLYDDGRPSWGYWVARGDQYCSQWPPADGWACYDVHEMHGAVRFIGQSGDATTGIIVE